ncbi:MAG: YdcF family protein [Anaerolineales bacterium]
MPDTTSLVLTPDVIQEITAIVFDFPSLPIQPCDVIFVFGGSHPGLWLTAAEAYHKGLGNTIIVTGGHKPGVHYHFTWTDGTTPESHVITRELIKLSVPINAIVYEDQSTNSLDNVLFAKRVYDFSNITSILVVCKNYGVGRQCRTLKQHLAKSVNIIPYPFDTEAGNGPFITRYTWMNYEQSKSFVFAQAMKIYRYGKLGHLVPVEHISPALEELMKKYVPE